MQEKNICRVFNFLLNKKMYYIYILSIVFFFFVCDFNNNYKNDIIGNWEIKSSAHPLNNFDECFLGEEIEFLKNNKYIMKSNCFSERPFGVIKAGYYEFYKSNLDSLSIYNNYHSIMSNMRIIKIDNNLLELEYPHYRFSEKEKKFFVELHRIVLSRIK